MRDSPRQACIITQCFVLHIQYTSYVAEYSYRAFAKIKNEEGASEPKLVKSAEHDAAMYWCPKGPSRG